MTLEAYLKEIEIWLRQYLIDNHQENYVLGLSGGVDSSLVAGLVKNAVGKEHLHALILPIDSNHNDELDAVKVAKQLDINYQIIDLSDTYHSFLKHFNDLNIELDTLTKSNLKVRLRMCALYALAQKIHGLVVGTDNADERYTGYFTKYGDGGVDLLPIVHLTKHEVVEAAKIIGVSNELAERVPSAGLFDGQTDEKELGISYKDLDNFLLGNISNLSDETVNKIKHLHRISEHKRIPIPEMKEFIRDGQKIR